MSLAQRASRLTRTRPPAQTVPPTYRRVAAAGLAAAAVSLAADLMLATIGRAAFAVPASFGKFAFGTYAMLTVLGVAGAAGHGAVPHPGLPPAGNPGQPRRPGGDPDAHAPRHRGHHLHRADQARASPRRPRLIEVVEEK